MTTADGVANPAALRDFFAWTTTTTGLQLMSKRQSQGHTIVAAYPDDDATVLFHEGPERAIIVALMDPKTHELRDMYDMVPTGRPPSSSSDFIPHGVTIGMLLATADAVNGDANYELPAHLVNINRR